MKKSIIALLLVLLLALTACSGNNDAVEESESTVTPTESEGSVSPTPSEDPAENAIEEVAVSNAADLGDYHVEIKSAVLTQDYEGNPAIVVNYSWTNNSEDTTSAMVAVSCSAFQDGVGLENAIMASDDVYDVDLSMTEVRPGTTIDVQSAFVLNNETSVVEIEIEEWFSLDENPPIAYQEFDPTTL